MSATGIVAVLFVILFPWLAMILAERVALFKKLGSIVTCYIAGALLGNIGWEHGGEAIIKEIVDISIPIAIPLFIYSTDFMGWLRHSRATVISFLLCIVSVVFVTVMAVNPLPIIHPRGVANLRNARWCLHRRNAQPYCYWAKSGS
jgi:uncharacterized membrane protein